MNDSRTELLGKESVGRLLFKLSIPAIVAQLINLLYNMVDRIYIGRIPEVGSLALTGVGVCLPLILLISAFAALVSMGGAPRSSIFLGAGDKENAEKTMGNCAMMLVIVSITLTVLFLLFADKLLLMFGASENTIEYAATYMRIYTFGTIFVQTTLGMNAFITAQGFAKTSMISVLIGAVANIILDPVLIFGFNMGVSGAALATVISQSLSAFWVIKFLTGNKTVLRIKKEHLKLSKEIVLPCLMLGLAPFIMQATESIIAICFNSSLYKYGGDIAVGSMTILMSAMQFSMLPLSGFTQGAQPILSYNFGAKNPERVKKTFKILFIVCLIYSTTLWALLMMAPQTFAALFTNSSELISFTIPALRIYMAVSLLLGAQIACQQTFIAIGNAKISLFLALLRKVFLLIPLIYILPMFFTDKTMAVFTAEPVADIIAVTVTCTIFAASFKKALKGLEEPQQENLEA